MIFLWTIFLYKKNTVHLYFINIVLPQKTWCELIYKNRKTTKRLNYWILLLLQIQKSFKKKSPCYIQNVIHKLFATWYCYLSENNGTRMIILKHLIHVYLRKINIWLKSIAMKADITNGKLLGYSTSKKITCIAEVYLETDVAIRRRSSK